MTERERMHESRLTSRRGVRSALSAELWLVVRFRSTSAIVSNRHVVAVNTQLTRLKIKWPGEPKSGSGLLPTCRRRSWLIWRRDALQTAESGSEFLLPEQRLHGRWSLPCRLNEQSGHFAFYRAMLRRARLWMRLHVVCLSVRPSVTFRSVIT